MNGINVENRESGAITILMAVVLVGLLAMAAFAVDIGYGLVVKSQLQNAADTGALAGTRELALVYDAGNYYWGSHQLTAAEKSDVLSKINFYTQKNAAGGKAISVNTSDVLFGKFDVAKGDVVATTPAETGVTAIKVKARRDATANGAIQTTLARVMGIQSMHASATSAAQVSALKVAPSNVAQSTNGAGLGIPVGISKYWFTSKSSPCANHDKVDHAIRLYPTNSMVGCAGWHTFTDYPPSAEQLKTILKGLKAGTYVTPETTAGVTKYQFTNGNIATDFTYMKQLFEQMKDPTTNTWTTVVPVYDKNDCTAPNENLTIIGYATVWIYSVQTSPANVIDATVDCNVIDWGTAGGTDYGTLVGSPGMVQ